MGYVKTTNVTKQLRTKQHQSLVKTTDRKQLHVHVHVRLFKVWVVLQSRTQGIWGVQHLQAKMIKMK